MTAMKLAFALVLALLTGCVDVDLGDDDTVADTGPMTAPQERCEAMVECGMFNCDDEIQAWVACRDDPVCPDVHGDEKVMLMDSCLMDSGCWLVDCETRDGDTCSDALERDVLSAATIGQINHTTAECIGL